MKRKRDDSSEHDCKKEATTSSTPEGQGLMKLSLKSYEGSVSEGSGEHLRNTTPLQSVDSPASSSFSKHGTPDSILSNPESIIVVSPSSDEIVPVTVKPWWQSYQTNNIVAIDTEYVKVVKSKKQVAGTVSIVNFAGDVIYHETVKHAPGTFWVDKYTKSINGFRRQDLKNGKEFKFVQSNVKDQLEGKLVICIAGRHDFEALDLTMTDYDCFDLHQHFFRKWKSDEGKLHRHPIGLRSLVHHFMDGMDIHSGVHSSIKDAQCTMAMFRDVYIGKNIKSTFLDSRENLDEKSFVDVMILPKAVTEMLKK